MQADLQEETLPQLSDRPSRTRVWDIWVRLFHWSLVCAVTVAAITGFVTDATWIRWHVAGGLAALALVIARIVWGFLGSTHARFSDFMPGRNQLIEHLRGRTKRHLGHNPLGALMVFALIGLILALSISGIGVLGGLLRTGPLAADLGTATGSILREIHEVLAITLLALVLMHVGGVSWESWKSHENLPRAMVTGWKQSRPDDIQDLPVNSRGVIALLIIGVLTLAAITGNAKLSSREIPGLPIATIDTIVDEECSACHMIYHPSLLPAASWSALIAGLDDHFGEDASLDIDTSTHIESWLKAHAADTVDTRPARGFASVADDGSFALTETRFWQRTHHELPEAVFDTAGIGSRSNCAACHLDADTGLFSPFAIDLP